MAQSDLEQRTATCTYCPKMCRHACPVSTATGHETLIPQAKMEALGGLLREHLSWSAVNAEALWACTGCGHCTEYCDHDIKPGLDLFRGRQLAMAHGAAPAALEGYHERFLARSHRLASAQAGHNEATSEARVAFWPGCDALDKGDAAITAFEELAAAQALPIQTLAIAEACAGYPLLAAGLVDEFRWHARKVGDALRGTETLVMNCSACLHTLRHDYKAAGVVLPSELLSVAEYLEKQMPAGARTADKPADKPAANDAANADAASTKSESESDAAHAHKPVVYYHDPCYHARYNNVQAAPRALLRQVAEVREFAWCGTDAECCGGAGLLPKTMPEVADAMAKHRLEEVARAGGGTVVTSCATCTFQLRRNAPPGITVLDLPQALTSLKPRP